MPRLTATIASLLAVGGMLAAGAWYDHDVSYIRAAVGDTLPIRKPLNQLPSNIAGWKGKDAPLDPNVVKVAGATDYVNRQYTSVRGEVLNLYASYYGNPRTMVLHYPDVCYPSAGWRKLADLTMDFPKTGDAASAAWPALVYRFDKARDSVTVISFFNVGGQYTADRHFATRAAHRAIGSEDAAKADSRSYLGQVQITLYGDARVWTPDRILRVAGGFLNGLMPLLNEHLP